MVVMDTFKWLNSNIGRVYRSTISGIKGTPSQTLATFSKGLDYQLLSLWGALTFRLCVIAGTTLFSRMLWPFIRGSFGFTGRIQIRARFRKNASLQQNLTGIWNLKSFNLLLIRVKLMFKFQLIIVDNLFMLLLLE